MKKPPKGIGLYIITLKTGEQKYQSRLWNPVLKRIGKKKNWESKDLQEIIIHHLEFKKAYEANGFEIVKSIEMNRKYPEMLVQCAAFYEKFLRDDPALVPAHKAKNRTEKYISYELKYIKTFLNILKDEGVKISHVHINAVNDELIGLMYDYLQQRYDAQEIGDVTWNKHFKACSKWFNCIKSFGIVEKNPFSGVKLKTEHTDPEFAELHELDKLLEVITPENGINTRGKSSHTVNYYRPWLKSYILVSVFIGGRPDQMASLRWKDWQGDYIILDNTKVNNLKNERGNKNYIYVHPELAQLLSILIKDSQSDSDFILVPESKNRKHLKEFVSRAFKHFWKQTDSKKSLTLNNLRHTYINAILNVIGEEGINIHNRKETAIKHYLSRKKRLELEKGKTLFNIDVKATI